MKIITFGRGIRSIAVERTDDIAEKAEQIVEAGYRLRTRFNSTGCTLAVTDETIVLYTDTVPSGSLFEPAVDRLINRAFSRLFPVGA